MNFFEKVLELINWIKIFLSPFVISLIIGGLIFLSSNNIWIQSLSLLIVVLGIITGIYLAEKIRKKHGTERFMAKINESPDLDNIKK